MPRLDGAWRFLSGQVYFDLMGSIAGLNPVAYRLTSLVAHAVTSCLVFQWTRRWVAPAAAFVGATFFAVHPASYGALYSISSIGEILMALFAVATLILAAANTPVRWLAVPCFALSLLSKETTLLLPLVALAEHRKCTRRWFGPVPMALLAVSVGHFIALATQDAFGVRRGDNLAYAINSGALVPNLLTYARWILDACILTLQSFSDAVDPARLFWGGIVLFVLLALTALRPLRERGYDLGLIAAAAFIAPVLPLAHHTYHYYLYAPLVGIGLATAALWDAVTALLSTRSPAERPARGTRRSATPKPYAPAPSSTRAWVWAGAAAALLVLNGAMVVRKVETYPFIEGLRADALVDRALIAERAHHDLEAARLSPGARLHFWSPASLALERQRRPDADLSRETYWEKNVRNALLDGLGVRVLMPQVREAVFVREFQRLGDSILYAVYLPDGRIAVSTAAALDSMMRSQPVVAGTEP